MYTIYAEHTESKELLDYLMVATPGSKFKADFEDNAIEFEKDDNFYWSSPDFRDKASLDSMELLVLHDSRVIDLNSIELDTNGIHIGFIGREEETAWPVANPWILINNITQPTTLNPRSQKEFAMSIFSALQKVQAPGYLDENFVLYVHPNVTAQYVFWAIDALHDFGIKKVAIQPGDSYDYTPYNIEV